MTKPPNLPSFQLRTWLVSRSMEEEDTVRRQSPELIEKKAQKNNKMSFYLLDLRP